MSCAFAEIERSSWDGPRNVLQQLVGSWCLRRSIDNGASMTGRAVITDKNDGQFGYREQGQLRLSDGRLIDAERCYIFAEDAAGFRVLFSESPPRLFHRIALSRVGPNLIGDGIHLCGDDRYDSRYEFRVDGSFIVRHGVVGPRKRYTIETRYCRQA